MFAAAPVLVGREDIKTSGDAMRAVLVNAGCANACTGAQGIADTRTAIAKAAAGLGLKSTGSTLMLSTGVIGVPLKMDRIKKGIDSLSASSAASHEDWLAAATAIMTTDTFPKLRSKEFSMHGKAYRIAGWSKGAGMIHPNMATMLAGIFTDAAVSKPLERSFNAISVDGDTSTNDTLVVLANGAAGTKLIDNVNSNEFAQFQDNLTEFAAELAGLVVRDGEGATKFLDIQIENARTFEEGKAVATAIAKSPLVKTAMFGQDANWGRIVCAVGYSGVDIEPTKVNLWMESKNEIVHLFKDGAPYQVFDQADKDKAKRILTGEDIVIRVDLGLGKVKAQMFTCDLSFDYVKINIDYT
ncbi:arginine biosynthesis protein ArgJ [Chytriomyces cf. hyalinus JEL632]|nr:arginine biosynthesis protein ArgJ [Chytriomyces cf. hyalinus JEL632]